MFIRPPAHEIPDTPEHDRTLYKQRNRIERMFGHLKINRTVATRYDQLTSSFLVIVHLVTAGYWLKFVHAALAARLPGCPARAMPVLTAPVATNSCWTRIADPRPWTIEIITRSHCV